MFDRVHALTRACTRPPLESPSSLCRPRPRPPFLSFKAIREEEQYTLSYSSLPYSSWEPSLYFLQYPTIPQYPMFISSLHSYSPPLSSCLRPFPRPCHPHPPSTSSPSPSPLFSLSSLSPLPLPLPSSSLPSSSSYPPPSLLCPNFVSL